MDTELDDWEKYEEKYEDNDIKFPIKKQSIEEKILKALADGSKSGNDLEKWTRTSRSNQDDVLSKMQDKEKVKKVGKGRSCKWSLVS